MRRLALMDDSETKDPKLIEARPVETRSVEPTSTGTQLVEASALPVPRRRRRDPTAPIRRRPKPELPSFTGMPMPNASDAAYGEFLPDAARIVVTEPSKRRLRIAYGLCTLIGATIAWAILWHLSIFAIAPGEFQARGGNQVVEPVEPGQISAVPVKNGNHVKKGDLLLQIDPTAAQAQKTIVESRLADARAEAVRRDAASFVARSETIDPNAAVAWPKIIPADVKARQESVLRADLSLLAATIADLKAKLAAAEALRAKLVANIGAQASLIDSRTKRMGQKETLAQQGWDSRAAVLQALEPLRQAEVTLANYKGDLAQAVAAIPVLKAQIDQTRRTFIATNTDAGAAAERQVAELVQQLSRADVTLANLSLRAPVSGTVQSMAVTNVGQSVKVGDELMQVAPDAVPLEVQAYVLNTDIGFVREGQPATLKIDTFPFTRYGTISGKVTHVGADAVTGAYALAQQKNNATTVTHGTLSVTNAAQQMTDLVFPVTIIPDKTTIDVEGRAVPLTAGMSVVAEIETERQRAITYVLYPLTKAFRGQ